MDIMGEEEKRIRGWWVAYEDDVVVEVGEVPGEDLLVSHCGRGDEDGNEPRLGVNALLCVSRVIKLKPRIGRA